MTDPTQALPADGPRIIAGRYELQEMLGRGGSAEVWRAEDTSLHRPVALKLVTVPTDESAQRAGDEARTLARLNHPSLVPVYDAGTDDAGRPWVVMELVEGETLGRILERGPLSAERTAQIGLPIAEALAYVHARGLVHRDVKPGNILVGNDGRVRLTDFGIARLVDAARVTSTGLMVGTASYLAPEQVAGEPVGPAADVYALGLVLLECLTGRREYSGSTVEVALARLNRPPQIPADLPNNWATLLTAMTQRQPERRPAPEDIAPELRTITTGGAATTVLPVAPRPAEHTQVMPRTAAAPRPEYAAPQPLPPTTATRQAPPTYARRPPSSSSSLPWVMLLLGIIAALVVGFLVYDQTQTTDVGQLPAISPDLPPELQTELQRLQDAVNR